MAQVLNGVENEGIVVLGTGSAAFGKLAANSGVDIGDVDVTSLVAAQLPAALGQLAMAASMSVVVASDQGDLPVAVTHPWDTIVTADATADDSDKTFEVTASKIWQLMVVQVSLTTTAAVGNRQMTVDVTDDSDNLLARMRAGVTQAASLTYTYTFGVGLSDQPAVLSLHLTTPLLPLILPAGYKIRVYDSAAIAAAADDMTVRITIMERAA